MKRLLAFWLLLANFGKDVLLGGARTTAIVLRGGKSARPGLVHMSYGDLSETAANLLAALITVTPGTTTVDIDLQREQFLLHLLDVEDAEATLASIESDYLEPIRTLFRGEA